MEKLCIALVICSMSVAMPLVHGISQGREAVEEWFQELPYTKQKVTRLHFYLHDIVSGKNPTSVNIVHSNTTLRSPTLFGALWMMDDPLTVEPRPDSKIIGRAQGLYGLDGLEEVAIVMSMNLVFTEGEYNGSTLSVLGHNPVLHKYRELPIIGGSGIFRLARGIATVKTYVFNKTSGDSIVDYHVTVLHY